MGQCSSQPEVEVGVVSVNHDVHKNSRPEQQLGSSVTVRTAVEDASFSIVTLDRSEEPSLEQQVPEEVQEEEPKKEEEEKEEGTVSEDESEESGEGYEEESESESSEDSEESDDASQDDGPRILPQSLQPTPAPATPQSHTSAEEWYRSYVKYYGNQSLSSCPTDDWSSELEVSMTSIGDLDQEETPKLHLSISSDLDKEVPEQPAAKCCERNDDSLSQIFPPQRPPTAKRRCSHATDPLSSWSDLNTSLHPECFVPRRGSVTSWGGLNLSTSTGASLNPYGFATNRRGSMSSQSHQTRERSLSPRPCGGYGRDRSKSPGPGGRARRRYSITPSIDTVSESEDFDDSDVSFVLYNTESKQ